MAKIEGCQVACCGHFTIPESQPTPGTRQGSGWLEAANVGVAVRASVPLCLCSSPVRRKLHARQAESPQRHPRSPSGADLQRMIQWSDPYIIGSWYSLLGQA
jgi:hypothetical protein